MRMILGTFDLLGTCKGIETISSIHIRAKTTLGRAPALFLLPSRCCASPCPSHTRTRSLTDEMRYVPRAAQHTQSTAPAATIALPPATAAEADSVQRRNEEMLAQTRRSQRTPATQAPFPTAQASRTSLDTSQAVQDSSQTASTASTASVLSTARRVTRAQQLSSSTAPLQEASTCTPSTTQSTSQATNYHVYNVSSCIRMVFLLDCTYVLLHHRLRKSLRPGLSEIKDLGLWK